MSAAHSPLPTLRKRAHLATALVLAWGLLDVFAAFAYLFGLVTAERDGAALVQLLVNALRGVVTMAAAVAFLSWVHRAVQNAQEMGASAVASSPSDAVAAWLIPVVNLVRPYALMRRLDQSLESSHMPAVEVPFDPAMQGNYRRAASTVALAPVSATIFGLWWALYLTSSLVQRVGLVLVASVLGTREVSPSMVVYVLGSLGWLTAAALCARIVWRITERAELYCERSGAAQLPHLSR